MSEHPEATPEATLLIADDSEVARRALRSLLEPIDGVGAVLEAKDGREAVEIAESERPTAVLMDIQMPGMDGIAATEELHRRCPKIPVIVLSASLDPADVRRSLEAGASGYVVKSTDIDELRTSVVAAIRGQGVLASQIVRPVIAHYVELLETSRDRHRAVIESLAAAVEAKDVVTSRHLRRVSRLAVTLATNFGYDLAGSEDFLFGCLLHDVGKIGVPEVILAKPGPLTDAEWAVMRLHPETGARVIGPLGLATTTLEVVFSHHERWDGRGYPDGLKGSAIPLAARIFSVCDALDAMTSTRPYRSALSFEEAVKRIRAEAGGQFDPDVVAALLAAVEGGSMGPDGNENAP